MDKEMIFWIENGNAVKVEVNFEIGTAVFYDRFGNILAKRQGLSHNQLKEIVKQIQKQLTKRKKVGFYYI